MVLEPKQREQLYKALITAFPSHGALAMFVSFGLNEDLATIAPQDSPSISVWELIRWAEAQGRIRELVQAAVEQNPGNLSLRELVPMLKDEPWLRGTLPSEG